MGNCLSEGTVRDEDLHTFAAPHNHASHMVFNPLGRVVQFGNPHSELNDDDPISKANQLQQVNWVDNGIPPMSKATNREKAELISRNARQRPQAKVAEAEVEANVDFE